VPVGDLVLAEAPAEKGLGAGDLRGEVDQPRVRVLHDPAELVNRVDATGDAGMLAGNLLVEGGRAGGVDRAAVPRDLQCQLLPLELRRRKRRTVLDELLGQRSHLREHRVRLFAGEVSRRHARIIERKVAASQREWADRAIHPTRLTIWVALVALLTFAQVYGRYVAETDLPDDPLYSSSFAAASLTQWVLLGALALGLAAGARHLLALRPPRRVGRAALVALGTFLLVVGAGALLSTLGLNPASEQGLVPDEWPPPDQLVFAANVLLVVLAGPFVEELLFRGLGFSLLRPFGRALAVVGSAAAFATVHGLVEGFALIFLLGLGLAVMREVTGSVLPGFALHATFNAIAVTAAALSSG
jgi:uncharacterized protein